MKNSYTETLKKSVAVLTGSARNIVSEKDSLKIVDTTGREVTFNFEDLTGFPVIERSTFYTFVTLAVTSRTFKFKFFNFLVLTSPLTPQRLNFKGIAGYLHHYINLVHNQYNQQAVMQYLRDSSIEQLEVLIEPILTSFRQQPEVWKQLLQPRPLEKVGIMESLFPLTKHSSDIRNSYEEIALERSKKFFDAVETNPLTIEQRLAVIRENDRNLVIAGAGTGKTSVIIAKVLYLIHEENQSPDDLLVLAYNKKAAKELQKRVRERGSYFTDQSGNTPQVSTFHALGLSILKAINHPYRLSKLTEDETAFGEWLVGWCSQYIQESANGISAFLQMYYRPVNIFDFKTLKDYEEYVQINELRTLQGELVRSYQELLIANWLFINGVKYEYEPRYVTKRRVELGFDYRPDFKICDTNIYIEHFGIDRNNRTHPEIDSDRYVQSMHKKFALHTECDTQLISTYHYNWIEGELFSNLHKQLSDLGVKLTPLSKEELLTVLNEKKILTDWANTLRDALKAIRSEQLTEEDIKHRLESASVPRAQLYAETLSTLEKDYIAELRRNHEIDFDDMIIEAANAVRRLQYKPTWKFILVDEFQDISESRMSLVRALVEQGENPTLMAVGDDWQSIYRFNGGKLELTTRFDKLVGSHSRTTLQKTFRYNNSIAETAGRFVMKNPEQYTKHIQSHEQVTEPQVFMLDATSTDIETSSNMAEQAAKIVTKIREHDPKGEIVVLARYNYLLNDAHAEFQKLKINTNIKLWTFHGSKGLEGDYSIILGLAKKRLGFPNERLNDELVDALLPPVDGFAHSEERRLMYVALTRARKKAYLITDSSAPSVFTRELMEPEYNVHIVSASLKTLNQNRFKCPNCKTGFFDRKISQFRDKNSNTRFYYQCNTNICGYTVRECKNCRAPTIDKEYLRVCANNKCQLTTKICPKCGRDMKLRTSEYGDFYGCSGFGLGEDSCSYKEKLKQTR